MDDKICWTDEGCISQMVSKHLFNPHLIETAHGQVLKEISSDLSHYKCIDIGCGAGASQVFFDDYTGADLPVIIDQLSKVVNPDLDYIKCDFQKDNLEFIGEYDVVLMNAFIDVLKNPLEMLHKILKHSSKYIILHRQEFSNEPTSIQVSNSYGGITHHSIINCKEFDEVLTNYDFEVIKELSCGFENWNDGGKSILITKKL